MDKYIYKIYHNIPIRVKKTFVISLLFEIVSHLYVLTNFLYNHDGVESMYRNTDGLSSGRWLLRFATSISGSKQMPSVIVLMSFIYLAILCCAVIEIFDISSILHICIICGAIISFPTVVCTFSYLFTADAYFLSAMLSTLSVYCAKKLKYGCFLSIILLTASIGIYQAYLSLASGIFISVILISIINEKKEMIAIIKEGFKYIFILLSSMGLYYIILQVLLKINHISLSDYRGINEMGKYTLSEIPSLLFITYKEVLDFYFLQESYSYIPGFLVFINRIIFIFIGILSIWVCYKRNKHSTISRILFFFIILFIFPIGVNLMQVVNTQDRPHVLMILSYVVFYIIFIKLTDIALSELNNIKIKVTSAIICNLLCVIVIYYGYILTNESYLRLQLAYESTYSFATRLVNSIESNENYRYDKPVLIYGNFNYIEYPARRTAFDKLTDMTGVYSDYIVYTSNQLRYFLNDSLNVTYIEPENQIVDKIINCDTFKNMNCYPHIGSVQDIEGVLTVKLSE